MEFAWEDIPDKVASDNDNNDDMSTGTLDGGRADGKRMESGESPVETDVFDWRGIPTALPITDSAQTSAPGSCSSAPSSWESAGKNLAERAEDNEIRCAFSAFRCSSQ